MKTKIRQKWILILGILIIALGLVHVSSTFFFYQNINKSMLPNIFFFVVTGLSVILSGSLIIYCSGILEKSEKISSFILRIVLIYFYVLAVGAIITMTNNPFSYIMLILCVFLSIPVLLKPGIS